MAGRYKLSDPTLEDTLANRRAGGDKEYIAELGRQAGNLRKGSRDYRWGYALSGGDREWQREFTNAAIEEPRARDQQERAYWAQTVSDLDKQIAAIDAQQLKGVEEYLKNKKGYSDVAAKEAAAILVAAGNNQATVQSQKIQANADLQKQNEAHRNALELKGNRTPQVEAKISRLEHAMASGIPGDLEKEWDGVENGKWDDAQKQAIYDAINIPLVQERGITFDSVLGDAEEIATQQAKGSVGSSSTPAFWEDPAAGAPGGTSVVGGLGGGAEQGRRQGAANTASRLAAHRSKLGKYSAEGNPPGFDPGIDVDPALKRMDLEIKGREKKLQGGGVRSGEKTLNVFDEWIAKNDPNRNVQAGLAELGADHPLNAYPDRRKELVAERDKARLTFEEKSKPKPYTYEQAQVMQREAMQNMGDKAALAAEPVSSNVTGGPPASAVAAQTPPTQGDNGQAAAKPMSLIDEREKQVRAEEVRQMLAKSEANREKLNQLSAAGSVFGGAENPFILNVNRGQ